MHAEVVLRPIGFVRGGRAEAEDDSWDAVEAVIALDEAPFGAEAVAGFSDFSHIAQSFHFDWVA